MVKIDTLVREAGQIQITGQEIQRILKKIEEVMIALQHKLKDTMESNHAITKLSDYVRSNGTETFPEDVKISLEDLSSGKRLLGPVHWAQASVEAMWKKPMSTNEFKWRNIADLIAGMEISNGLGVANPDDPEENSDPEITLAVFVHAISTVAVTHALQKKSYDIPANLLGTFTEQAVKKLATKLKDRVQNIIDAVE